MGTVLVLMQKGKSWGVRVVIVRRESRDNAAGCSARGEVRGFGENGGGNSCERKMLKDVVMI